MRVYANSAMGRRDKDKVKPRISRGYSYCRRLVSQKSTDMTHSNAARMGTSIRKYQCIDVPSYWNAATAIAMRGHPRHSSHWFF